MTQQPTTTPLKGKCAGILMTALLLLAPLKFGSLTVVPDVVSFYPDCLFDWKIVNFPAHFFGIASGVLFAVALFTLPFPDHQTAFTMPALLWSVILPLSTLIGAINGVTDFAVGEIVHIFGVGAFAGAIYLIMTAEPRWRGIFLGAIAWGTILTCVNGLHQYFVEMAELRAFVEQQQAEGIAIGRVMLARIYDDRVYATMVSANVLAGFLLICALPCVLFFGKLGAKIQPPELSRIFFMVIIGAIIAFVFALTRSRTAFCCAGVALFFALLWKLKSTKLRIIALVGALVLAFCAGTYFYHSQRGVLSVTERFGYLRSTWEMVNSKPIIGHGWGNFHRYHIKHKKSLSDEAARSPHNFIASYASQCGVLAGIVAAATLLFPLLTLWKNRKEMDDIAIVAFIGYGLFTVHLLLEISDNVPGTMAVGIALLFLALPIKNSPIESKKAIRVMMVAQVAIAALAINGNYMWVKGEVATKLIFSLSQPQTREELDMTKNHQTDIDSAYQTAAKARPNSPYPAIFAGDAYYIAQNPAKAEEMWRIAIKTDNGLPGIHYRLAKMAAIRGDFATAKREFEVARALFPHHPDYSEENQKKICEPEGVNK